MAAMSADEKQKKRRRSRLLRGVALGAAAVGLPALLYRWSSRRASPLPPHGWGRGQVFVWRDGQIHYQRVGHGAPLVLLHSLGPGHDGIQWRTSAEALARDHLVLAPDLPGWGRSAAAPVPMTPATYVDFIVDFVRQVAREPVVLVAAHRSAAFAIHAVEKLAGDVHGLALVTPRGLKHRPVERGAQDKLLGRLLEMPVLGTSAVTLVTSRSAIRRHLTQEVYADAERVDDALVEHHYAACHQPGAFRALEAYLAGDLELDVAEALPSVACPAWIGWGRRAVSPPVETADLWMRALPEARLEVFEGCGLLPHAEAPGQFCRQIEEYVRRLDARNSGAAADTR